MYQIQTTEMHTAGEPLRVIDSSNLPKLQGDTMLEKTRYLRGNHDDIRKLVMSEPRGHRDMFGVYLVEPDLTEADVGLIFIHNEGYSPMCGHGVIALGRYAVDNGLVKSDPDQNETKVVFQCPCGPVEAFVAKSGHVRFNSVPCFIHTKDFVVGVPQYGDVKMDIVYGGAFYAVVIDNSVGLNIKTSPSTDMVNAAIAIKGAAVPKLTLEYPEGHGGHAFLYGVIFTDGKDQFSEEETTTCCVFADQQFDRSPCGSGTSTRVAQQFFRGHLKLGQSRKFASPIGSVFSGKPVKEVTYGKYKAVITEVSGKGYYTGKCTFTREEEDEISKGFLLR